MRCNNNPFENSAGSRRGWPYYNMDRIVCENGTISGMFPNAHRAGTFAPSKGFSVANTVIDKAIYIAGPFSKKFSGQGFATGLTVRNVLLVVPSVLESSAMTTFTELSVVNNTPTDAEDALWRAQPVRFHNITAVHLRTTGQNNGNGSFDWYPTTGQSAWLDVMNFTLENCVRHVPNLANANNEGPFTTGTLSGLVPRWAGRRWNFGLITLTNLNVAPGGKFFVPYTDIPAQNSNGDVATQPTQTYWTLDNPSHNSHYITNGSSIVRDLGKTSGTRITASYGATGITFTNNSSTTFTGTWRVFIDRRAYLPPADTARATPTDVALSWMPASGSSAITTEDLGLFAVDDLLGRTRTVPRTRGAFEAVD
jgi:hypothetical protein